MVEPRLLVHLQEDARQLRAVANQVERSILTCAGLSSNVVDAEGRFVLASSTWKPTPREREGILEACRVPSRGGGPSAVIGSCETRLGSA